MKTADIVSQLRIVLPKSTDYFSDKYKVLSLEQIGSTVTAVTDTAHGQATNNNLIISGAKSPNALISLRLATNSEKSEIIDYIKIKNLNSPMGQIIQYRDVENIAIAGTADNHDLTEGWDQTVEIVGADQSDYNGVKNLLKVSSKSFAYQISGSPVTPATGSIRLLETYYGDYNGWQKITVIDTTTFTYEVTKTTLGTPAEGEIYASTPARIEGAVSAQRAFEIYTKQKAKVMWGFVVVGTGVANKDRLTKSDAISTPGNSEVYRQRLIQQFNVYVITPCTDELAAVTTRDSMDDILASLCKSVLRVQFPSPFAEPPYAGAVLSSHAFYDYNGAYYVHEFTFETTSEIQYTDTVDPDDNVAFREIDINFYSPFADDDTVVMTANIDLEDESL